MMGADRKVGAAERLIRAAEVELIAGYGHLEMQAVARRAKLSVGLAYHHFGSKAGLMAAVVANFFGPEQAYTEAAAAAGKDLSWSERERRRIRAMVDFYFDHPLAPLIVGPLSRAPEVLQVEQAHMRRQLEEGTRNLCYAQRKGVIAAELDPELSIAMVLGGVHQVLRRALETTPRPHRAGLSQQIWAFVAGALRARDA